MIVDDSIFRLITGMIVHDSFSVSGFAKDGLSATFSSDLISKLAAERDSKEILSSGEKESRNFDEYLDDSEAENEKMSKETKNKKHRRENTENVAARSMRQSIENKEKGYAQCNAME